MKTKQIWLLGVLVVLGFGYASIQAKEGASEYEEMFFMKQPPEYVEKGAYRFLLEKEPRKKRWLFFAPEVSPKEFSDLVKTAHNFLLDENNLRCLLFDDVCPDPRHDALLIVGAFLASPPAQEYFNKAMREERIRKTEEVLRKQYNISSFENAALGEPIIKLILDGYLESNYMDRQLKLLAKKLPGGYPVIIDNRNLLNYLTHLYYGSIPTEVMRDNMRDLLNPSIRPRQSGFERFLWGTWGYAKRFGVGTFGALKRLYRSARGPRETVATQEEAVVSGS